MNDLPWLALDVGGANVKVAHQSGPTACIPFELWKNPSGLSGILRAMMETMPPCGPVAVTMTAELCDCFATQAEGVRAVLSEVAPVFGRDALKIWGTDGFFHDYAHVEEHPQVAAASNWLALAEVVAGLAGDGPGLLIDVGSTTTDIVPLAGGKPVPRGRTDTERLRHGELVYAGAKRTPVCALATELNWKGAPMGIAAELFATTLDVYLTLGRIADDASDMSTADGRPATAEQSRGRLAKMVGSDREMFSEEDARGLALACDEVLMSRLVTSAKRVCGERVPGVVIVSGSGEFLARRVAEGVLANEGRIVSLGEEWGHDASTAGCAYALLLLAVRKERGES